ncbi:type 2 lanthipeptide synthetase LanM family protein [Marinactinospora thermotolerans]|uniref:Type 2 lantibiotic biosynthesis protein LanM n=2 Tax=Marinactinospora thermotolerans TaxID=531310 RepID=A0A1T4SLI3_9ACTN|nr:type 2 lanthipeptide synthetase LanM family protein [Marinactinospora thermotolerans]ARW80051.1 class-II lanthipeptide synthetase [Marinactinospora thermotolerans]SKA29013.1 type 2 lantibiotic biosynthesis protein LanM [Marinactinospora thermotolerans DSM 45154]
MGNAHPVDIAARACNLAERMRVVESLGGPPPTAPTDLGPLDTWRIGRIAGRLALKAAREVHHVPTPPRYDKDELVRVLTDYRRHELALDSSEDSAAKLRELLGDIHGEWLPTYRSALEGFDAGEDPDAGWRDFDTYYGRLAKACEPFLLELGRRLRGPRRPDTAPAAPGVVEGFQRHLLDRFELALAWAVEADAKVHCAQAGIDPDRASRDDYLGYLDSTFGDASSYHAFYLRFPVLGRWLAHVTRLLADYGRDLTAHLAADGPLLSRAFFDRPVTGVRAVRLGRSDPHAGARSVAFVDVELADGGTGTVVYKPRCIAAESAMQELLSRITEDGALDFATRHVLPRDGYGYEALIPSGRNRVRTSEQVKRIYRQLGGYLGVFHALGGGDLHFENVIVADGNAYICDCETVLGVRPKGQGNKSGTLLDSVFSTGLLEWPDSQARGGPATMRISGYTGGTSYEMPVAVPRIGDERLSFRAGVVHRTGVEVHPDAANRVFLGEQLVQPDEHADAIADGFARVYEWFRRPDAARHVTEVFTGVSVRFINRSTQVYAQALMSARHPKALSDPLEVDLLNSVVRTFPRAWDDGGILVEHELGSLWRLDVPLFSVQATRRDLVHDHRGEIPGYLELSPLEHVTERIGRLSDTDRGRQHHYITASLSTGEITSPSFVAACLDKAAQVGDRLCAALREPTASAPWTSYDVSDGRTVKVDVEGDLYHGAAGIALFLAHLDSLVPRPEFRRAAERALAHAVTACDTDRIGAFQGMGGLIYLLTHLSRLWDDPALLERAVRLGRELPDRIDADRHLDLFGGAAGLIPILLGLAAATDGNGLDTARQCADHLLRTAEADGEALTWPPFPPESNPVPLTGFAHGSAGIGWSLITLGAFLDRGDYVEAGRRAFAYEARHFDSTEHDWYDLRTLGGGVARGGRHYANAWCNGAAGIGLSRITGWAALGRDDEGLLLEARQALAATMRNFPRLRNDTLCHGRSGNAELFLRFAELKDEPAFRMEANVQAQAQWRHLESGEGDSTRFFPGLMLGIAGTGMHMLRLAAPDRVPSVLLLDPPVSTTEKG